MDQSAKSCKCYGSNENCAWCFGTGVVTVPHVQNSKLIKRGKGKYSPKADLTPLVRKFGPARVNKPNAAPQTIRSCDKCNFIGTDDGLRRHTLRWHPVQEPRKSPYVAALCKPMDVRLKSRPRPLSDFGKLRCYLCQWAVRRESINVHFRLPRFQPSCSRFRSQISRFNEVFQLSDGYHRARSNFSSAQLSLTQPAVNGPLGEAT